MNASDMHGEVTIGNRLRRLEEMASKLDTIHIRTDFDPEDWRIPELPDPPG
jgi:hypothetical protein